jgi:threonine aldolase
VLLGNREIIAGALRWRKALGGGMRQAGVLAAAGLYALEHHVARLAEDHANAEYLAQGLRAAGLVVEPPQTNMVYVQIPAQHLAGLRAHIARQGILATISARTRLVTHLDLSRASIGRAISAFRDYPGWTG